MLNAKCKKQGNLKCKKQGKFYRKKSDVNCKMQKIGTQNAKKKQGKILPSFKKSVIKRKMQKIGKLKMQKIGEILLQNAKNRDAKCQKQEKFYQASKNLT